MRTLLFFILAALTCFSCNNTPASPPELLPERSLFSEKGYQLDSVGYRQADKPLFPLPFASEPPACDTCDIDVYSAFIKPAGKNAIQRFEIFKRVLLSGEVVFSYIVHNIEFKINNDQIERVKCCLFSYSGKTPYYYLDTVITKEKLRLNLQKLDSARNNIPKGYRICGTAILRMLEEGNGDSKELAQDEARKKIRELLTR